MGKTTSSVVRYETVKNEDRRFGSATEYIPAMIYYPPEGVFKPMLLTKKQVCEALDRAIDNPEDAPRVSWYARLLHLVSW